jgi:lysophospholipase L1-like esterase
MVGANSGIASVINGNGFSNIATVGSALTNNKWYFVALRINATTATISLGDETTSVSHASGTCPAQGANYRAWFGGTASTYFPTADMALIRQWDGVLSDAEIEAERGSATPVRTTGLFGDWRLASDATKLANSSTGGDLVAAGAGPWADVTGPTVGAPVVEAVVQATAGNATSSMSGSVGLSASIAATAGNATSSFAATFDSGTGEVSASIAATAGNATSSMSGSVGVSGAIAATAGDATSSMSGSVGVSGAVAATAGNATSSMSGTVSNTGPLDWSGLMPLISRGKTYYGTGTPAQMGDGYYGYVDGTSAGAWSCTAGSWVAVNVGAGASQVLVGLSNDNASGGSYLSSVIQAYRLQVSNDSTNGTDGTWTTVVTVTGNGAYAREHKFSFTGYSWVKLLVDTCSGGQLDELNIWDASHGTPDTFAFLGDSITDGALRRHFYFGGGLLPSFQENVEANRPGHYPLQLNVGVTGQGASYWATNIASALALYPDVKYWCINLGMNDGASMPGQLSQWRTDMTTVVNAINAAGKTPIIARTTYTGAAGYGGGNYDTCGLRYLNDNGVDWVVSNLGVRAGPDLFYLFYQNAAAYAVTSDPHPNETGYKAWTNAWADNLGIADPNYRHGFISTTTGDATSSMSGSVTYPDISASIAATAGDATSSMPGSVGVSGAIAATADNATSSITGSVGVSGSIAATAGNATSSMSGTVGVSGAIAATAGNATSSITGTFTVAGEVSASIGATAGNATSSFQAYVGVSGATNANASSATSSFQAYVGVSGSIAATAGNATSSFPASTYDPGAGIIGAIGATAGNATSQIRVAATSVISFMRDVELDIATILGAQTSVTLGVDLFAGQSPIDVPDRYVMVQFTTGDRDGVIGEAVSGDVTYRNTVQVLIRGERGRYADTLALAKVMFTALTHPNQEIYLYCAPSSAAPTYIGPDANGRPKFSFDVECEYAASIGEGAIISLPNTGVLDLNGVILRAPDGSRYRITVGNNGALTTTAVS